VSQARLLITIKEEECCSSGICALTAPDVFDQREEDGVVFLLDKDPEPALHAEVKDAARRCPSLAIEVEEIPA